MARETERDAKREMTVAEAGKKGGQRVRELIERGKQNPQG